MKKFLLMVTAAALTAGIFFFPTEQKRIRKVISGLAEAAENESVDDLMEHISFNYRDEHGGSFLLVRKKAEASFRIYDSIDISADIVNIAVEESRAEVNLQVSIIASKGTDRGYIIGDIEKARDVIIYLEKSAYEWKVIEAKGFTGRDHGTQ